MGLSTLNLLTVTSNYSFLLFLSFFVGATYILGESSSSLQANATQSKDPQKPLIMSIVLAFFIRVMSDDV